MLRPQSEIASGDCYVEVWPPGATRSRHRCFLEKIYFAVSKIRRFPSLRDVFERERTEVSRESCPSLVSTSLLRREVPSIIPLSVLPADSVGRQEVAHH